MTRPWTFDELIGAQLMARTGMLQSGVPEVSANDLFLRNVRVGLAKLAYYIETENVPVGERCVHTEHCCVIHGCKYGDDDCPVQTRQKRQSCLCESCQYEQED